MTLVAPSSFKACAARHSVPAVSTMSSTSTQILPVTSPMMFMTFDSLGRVRRLSMMASSASSRRLAKARAHYASYVRGDDDNVAITLLPRVSQEHWRGVDVVHRN